MRKRPGRDPGKRPPCRVRECPERVGFGEYFCATHKARVPARLLAAIRESAARLGGKAQSRHRQLLAAAVDAASATATEGGGS